MDKDNNYYYGIDFLRWLAAFVIILYHYSIHFQINDVDYNLFLNYLLKKKEFAPNFVWLFWSISGFVFTNIYISRNVSIKKFFIARLARLYPLHFLTLLIVAILQILSIINFGHSQENYINDFYHFILHIFFASDWGLQNDWSYNVPIWSVSIEIPIYFLFFFSLFYLKRYNFLLPIALIIFFYYLLPYVINFFEELNIIKFNKWHNLAFYNFTTCIFYFFLGSFIFFFLKKFMNFYKELFFLSLIGTIFCIIILNTNYTFILAIKKIFPTTVFLISSLIIFFALVDNVIKNFFKNIIIFSNTSYSIYLIHFPLQLIIMIFFKKYSFSLELFNKFYIFLIFTLILQIISFFSYKYFEMPMRKLINDKFK